MRKTKNKPAKRRAQSQRHRRTAEAKIPFIEHFYELRKRLFAIALAVLAGGIVAYIFRQPVIDFLLWPAGNQQFIFTSPAGGFEFVFRLCLYAGIVAAIPVIIFQILRYLQPLIHHNALRLVAWGTVASAILAVVGMAFGYFLGLPAALGFLLQYFSSEQVEALITIQSYTSFVTMYMLGAAIIFQVPLVLLFINRIKPLKPSTLFRKQRWFIVIAFIAAAIISPTPDIPNLLILALPMVFMYQLGIALVWLANRKHREPPHLRVLREQDEQIQTTRLQQFAQAQASWQSALRVQRQTPKPAAGNFAPAKHAAPLQPTRRRVYLDSFAPRSRSNTLIARQPFTTDDKSSAAA